MNEKQYERELIIKIRTLFPGCHIMRNDPARTQGIPDILILYKKRWAMLEVKMDGGLIRPNQPHYVEHFNEMSYASFISPSNERDVMYELQSAFTSPG